MRTKICKQKNFTMELNIQSSGIYNIKSGEIFLTPTGEITIHCTLCDRKYYDFSDYTSHVGSEHLPIIEIEFFSDSEHSRDTQENADNSDFFRNNGRNQLNEFKLETSVPKQKPPSEEICHNVDETKAVEEPAQRHIQHDFDSITNLYKCTICDFACKMYKNLVGHVKRHSKTKPYKCSECDKGFYTRFELKTHFRTHTGDRPFLCNQCGQSFITSGKLSDHMKRHTNEKKYLCEVCNRTFFNTQNLRRHLAVHSNERSYECKICNASFKRLTALSNHRKLHENKKEYRCELCPARFNQRPGLYSHLKSKHSIPPDSSFSVIIEEPIEIEF